MAEIAVALWHRHLHHNPANPAWVNRDRFVLSNGHGSMLLYALLHLTGYDLPTKANTGGAHGAPLGEKEVAATREAIGWLHLPFVVPDEVRKGWDARAAGKRAERKWSKLFDEYERQFPREAAELARRMTGKLPADFAWRVEQLVKDCDAKAETIATRKASQNALEALVPALPELIGGSADLTGSNLTMVKGYRVVSATEGGNYLFYGVREFGMSSVMNGLALHGDFIPYGGTFLTFSDYARNALRMAALMKLCTLFVYTHDSISLGEDGPTHQAVEHAASLRLIPGLDVWRPCDTVETAVAWACAIERANEPSALLLSRQKVQFSSRNAAAIADVRRGGYLLADAADAKAVIIATGSEVPLALTARKQLATEGVAVRFVSMPSTDVFDRQDEAYRATVLPKALPCVAVEAGVTGFWRKYVGLEGAVVGIDSFGESAPAADLFKHFGFTAEAVAQAVKSVI
jgi:transketolase